MTLPAMSLLLRLLIVVAILHPLCVLAQWPHPKKISVGKGTRSINVSKLKVTSDSHLPNDVNDAFERFLHSIKEKPLVGINSPGGASGSQPGQGIAEVHMSLRGGGKSKRGQQPLTFDGLEILGQYSEAYHLSIPATGAIRISSNSSLGLLRALSTLETLTVADGRNKEARYITKTPIEIEDEPAYPYRGFLLDVARNYLPMPAIKRQVDAASLVKMNQMTLHITDSQSFPLQLPGKLKKLSEAGSYDGQVYTPEDMKGLIDYAAARGINVNVEIDMPGHTYQGVVQYDPSLIECPNKPDWNNWANEPPSGQLSLTNPKAKQYATDVIEATAKLFPSSYFSTGTDEVNIKCYGAKDKKDIDDKLNAFLKNAHAAVTKAGKTPMVWEEAVTDFPKTGKSLPPDTLVQTWISSDSVKKVLAANDKVRVINCPLDRVYLDLGRGEWLQGAIGQSYSPYCTWGAIYTFDPLNGTTPANAHRVVGSQTLLWSEQSDETVVDSLLWPRTAALAEVLWTGKNKEVNGKSSKLDPVEAQPRLNELRKRLVKTKGVGATPLQPQWCDNHSCPNPFG
ncbi:beta-hexosaminidase [Jaminaea rosea]|uniref:Beta-hexosaminidase n=1 Tax=Jaminaea rosea TaxID=1569628 RepID=A0A316USU5_9BASI|nr:beta-hexosaminidase [Jaminaea rosea]PWN28350.1 beta-hexosaminidase [Jaminaea rosea]